ncbi:uncharacterized protein LOC109848915 [Asparagus officinalis]|uniref:uncharacterized protein LOC109848915 n=1 Tax=Asparagus officinalis TaxID=4686 RepID=UPI00098E02C3|nr:uncharacterized protein LOC109848915 [Asparagus officinalis]
MEVAGDHSLGASEDDCKIVKFLGEIPSIYQLELIGHTSRNLAVGEDPVHFPAICSVKYLLININFEDMPEMLAAFCIFRSSLLMQKLHIAAISNIVRGSSNGFRGGGEGFNCTLSHLKVVEVTGFSGITS